MAGTPRPVYDLSCGRPGFLPGAAADRGGPDRAPEGAQSARLSPISFLEGGATSCCPMTKWNALAIQLDLCSANIVLDREAGASAARLSVGAGVRLPRLMRYCLRNRLGGLEFLLGIPGMVGGALVMNAGTREGSIADALLWLDVLDELDRRRRIPDRIYRRGTGLWDCRITGWSWVVASLWSPVRMTAQRVRLSAIMRERKRTQPLGWPSAGCIFKNPEGLAAGALIEKSGLKGLRMGDAEVSPKHANWIINRGHARARDVVALIEHIENRVELDSGVRLEREIRIIET